MQDEDTQPLSEPIIAPIKSKNFELLEKETPKTLVNPEFQAGLMEHPQLVRNIALVGHLHHGKTTFMGILTYQNVSPFTDLPLNVGITPTPTSFVSPLPCSRHITSSLAHHSLFSCTPSHVAHFPLTPLTFLPSLLVSLASHAPSTLFRAAPFLITRYNVPVHYVIIHDSVRYAYPTNSRKKVFHIETGTSFSPPNSHSLTISPRLSIPTLEWTNRNVVSLSKLLLCL